MNNTRRNLLAAIEEEVSALLSRLESIQEDEQEAFDNMPEGLQQGERGEKAQEALENIQTALDSINEATHYLSYAQE